MQKGIEFHRGHKLTGIKDLQGSLEGKSAAIWCSGPSFESYHDPDLPDDIIRVAINETIRKPQVVPHYWVLSDTRIVDKFAKHCPENTTVLAMHASSKTIKDKGVCPAKEIYTVDSMPEPPAEYDNEYQFFSRRTVAIGAVEMLRYMGVEQFFFFGLDLYRLGNKYYYDGENAFDMGERRLDSEFLIRGVTIKGQRTFQTPNLRLARGMLGRTVRNLWGGIKIWCVNSPASQQDVVPKIDMAQLRGLFSQDKPKAPPVKKEEVDNKPESSAMKPEEFAAQAAAEEAKKKDEEKAKAEAKHKAEADAKAKAVAKAAEAKKANPAPGKEGTKIERKKKEPAVG